MLNNVLEVLALQKNKIPTDTRRKVLRMYQPVYMVAKWRGFPMPFVLKDNMQRHGPHISYQSVAITSGRIPYSE